MSVYRRAWRFTLFVIVLIVTSPIWAFQLLPDFLGPMGIAVAAVLFIVAAVAAVFLFRCPKCGASAFLLTRNFLGLGLPAYQLWPRRHCAGCGRDSALVD